MASCRLPPGELAKRAGIGYYAARRFLQHGVKNRTAAALKLCDFFEIPVDITQKVQNPGERLSRILRETWDGSDDHAKLLAKLISSTKPFKITHRR